MRLVSVKQLAIEFGVSEATIRRRIADGTFRAYKTGRLIRLRPDEVDAALRAREIPTAAIA